jgi:hypothetical protein
MDYDIQNLCLSQNKFGIAKQIDILSSSFFFHLTNHCANHQFVVELHNPHILNKTAHHLIL